MVKSIFTGYIGMALARAEFNKLDDGTLSGRIPGFKGIIAFGKTLRELK